MGTALFVVLSLCLQVPVFENYYLCLGNVVMVFSLPVCVALKTVARNLFPKEMVFG